MAACYFIRIFTGFLRTDCSGLRDKEGKVPVSVVNELGIFCSAGYNDLDSSAVRVIILTGTRLSCQDCGSAGRTPGALGSHLEPCQSNGDVRTRIYQK